MGEAVQRVRGLIAGTLVGVPLGIFMMLWLHAVVQAAALGGAVVGIGVFAVVATRSDAREEAADAAWREAAPDLPPVSDRVALESVKGRLLAPPPRRKASVVAAGGDNAASISAADDAAESA
jgi:hypothetical protein